MRFTVTDTGVGFDAAQKARIFTRFQQADGSITRRFGGTGLGLAISRDLAELMGGELDCESTPGEGSRFWFELPLPPAAMAEVIADDTAEIAPERSLRILLADDHPANRKVIEVLLAPTGATLVSVENGQEALDAYAECGFDLVLMDMQMPVMDGLTATSAIRALETERGAGRTPLLMLTANAMPEHVAGGSPRRRRRPPGQTRHDREPVRRDWRRTRRRRAARRSCGRPGGLDRRAFVRQQPALAFQPARIARQRPVRADHPVAGHDDARWGSGRSPGPPPAPPWAMPIAAASWP